MANFSCQASLVSVNQKQEDINGHLQNTSKQSSNKEILHATNGRRIRHRDTMTPTLLILPTIISLATHGAAAFTPSSRILRVPSAVRPSSAPPLLAVKTSDGSTASRLKRIKSFTEWAKESGINYAGIELSSADKSGLGLYATQPLSPNAILIQVPTKLTLSVESPKDYNKVMEQTFFPSNPKLYRNAPWWACLSIQLNYYDKINPTSQQGNTSLQPWMDSLPRVYDTPLHWEPSTLHDLHYPPILEAISLQKSKWKHQYDTLASQSPEFATQIPYPDFVWGCETARSRAFSGAYSGSAFNPIPYATVAVLVATYLALGMGTVEQAANGAALVVCGTILKDFVLPKLLKVQKYVICPLIDMANHVGVDAGGNVAFEYFSDGFSLSVLGSGVDMGSEVCIQYGPRNNDQLLQYYGFVEKDNVHDIYILPPIRQWDIGALEVACGRKVGPGRLEKLDRAGLLGRESNIQLSDSSSDGDAANEIGGVVLTRATGIDPAVIQAMRALVSSDEEWENAGEAIGNFATQVSPENERAARLAIKRAMELELESKPTTVEEDENLLQIMNAKSGGVEMEELLAVMFRLEKKKLLKEAIRKM
eukprot:CCRYP_020940-RA/>CCRYP_020940-RA protein AED:0.05 eAED:0.05 QI:35/1/1/1/1/1/3/54/592